MPARESGARTFAVVAAGFCAFMNLFLTQPILPMLASVFHAGKAAVSLTITAATLGVAISAPFVGLIADRLGRKRIIVISAVTLSLTTLLAGTASSLHWLVFWRFLQGVATPGVFAVTVAYVNDEWPPGQAGAGVGAYVSGTVMGGFFGRILAGLIGEYFGWQWIFVVVGLCSAAISCVIAWGLPPETRFVRPDHPARFAGPAWKHLSNPRLLAVYAGGFCTLFTMLALFTYATFHLAAPPFNLSAASLGLIFCVYLVGAALTPMAGRGIDRFGHRKAILFAAFLGISGALTALNPHVWSILVGLTLGSCGVFVAQSAAVGFIGVVAEEGRALAVGLYVTFYYAGGSFGSTGPAWIWDAYGWPGCVGLIVTVQTVLACIGWFGWSGSPKPGIAASQVV